MGDTSKLVLDSEIEMKEKKVTSKKAIPMKPIEINNQGRANLPARNAPRINVERATSKISSKA